MTENTVTLEDIAKLAGTSIATVSRALNDSPLVRMETKRRIWRLARDHHYPFKASMPSAPIGATATLAIVVTQPQGRPERLLDPFLLQLIAGIGDAARDRDCDFTISHVAPTGYDDLVALMDTTRADGVIFIGQANLSSDFNRLPQSHLDRLVVWGADLPDQHYCSIGSDNRRGGQRATAHLLRLQRRHIMFLGDTDAPEVRQRLYGYRTALRDGGAGFDPELVVPAHFEVEFAEAAIDTMLERKVAFDGIVAASDLIAMGAIRSLTRAGVRVPEDVSVVGYDDIQFARYSQPSLTTIAQDTARAGRLMLSKLLPADGTRSKRSERIATDLIVRESCGG